MPDSKNMRWVDGFGTDAEAAAKTDDAAVDVVKPAVVEPAANDADGWKQYRRWISKAPATRSRRAGIDPALYSWKGYRDWSDQVKRNWTKTSDED
jgi:hypothetical protein